jgi:hypothetical protein
VIQLHSLLTIFNEQRPVPQTQHLGSWCCVYFVRDFSLSSVVEIGNEGRLAFVCSAQANTKRFRMPISKQFRGPCRGFQIVLGSESLVSTGIHANFDSG